VNCIILLQRISENPVNHQRTKEIAIKYHYIQEAAEGREVKMVFCQSDQHFADIFTKALPREKFVHGKVLIGVTGK